MRARRPNWQSGFTLIEMLVMIIIIAVLSSVAVPKYYNFAMRARFNESVQRVISLFAEARYRAIESGADCVVRYDPQSAMFVIESEVAAPRGDQPVALEEQQEGAPSVQSEPLILGENIAVGDFQKDEQGSRRPLDRSRNLEIRFHEDGRSEAAMILLQGSEGERAIVEIAPLTGRAMLREETE